MNAVWHIIICLLLLWLQFACVAHLEWFPAETVRYDAFNEAADGLPQWCTP